MAESAGISYKYLGEIERGDGNLSVQILLEIAGALGIEAGELFDREQLEAPLFKAKFILSELPEKDLALALDVLESIKCHSGEG